jgi:hypothetical protein
MTDNPQQQNIVRTPIWQTKAFHEWVKTVLITELTPENGLYVNTLTQQPNFCLIPNNCNY